jgi:hypothetical protein
MEWLNTIIQGTLLGGIYALFAIGRCRSASCGWSTSHTAI